MPACKTTSNDIVIPDPEVRERVVFAELWAFASLGGVMPLALGDRAPPLDEPALRKVT